MSKGNVESGTGPETELKLIVSDLLADGWDRGLPGEMGLLDAVEELTVDRARRYPGPRQAPGSRFPWKGVATGLMVDVHNGVRSLYRRASKEVFGHERASFGTEYNEQDATRAMMKQLVALMPKLSKQLQDDILKQFKAYHLKCEFALDERRPDRKVPLVCPACSLEEKEHHLLLRVTDFTGYFVRCSTCGEQWAEDELGWFARLQNQFAEENEPT